MYEKGCMIGAAVPCFGNPFGVRHDEGTIACLVATSKARKSLCGLQQAV